MRAFTKRALLACATLVDVLFSIVIPPAALVLLAYRRFGSVRLPMSTRELKYLGVFPIRNHYYEPLFTDSSLTRPLSEDRFLPGVDLNIQGQLEFLKGLTYSSELIEMRLCNEQDSHDGFSLSNPSFGPGDADFLYQFIRALKPSKVIEIGSGYSTRLARIALHKNYLSSNIRAEHTCIEPYEMKWLEELSDVKVVRKRVEDCDVDWGQALGPGDLLFVDSSHVIRPQGDVLKIYLEILPQLARGVYIHLHDILTPRDYPDHWVVKHVRFWNEQYLLEALLSDSNRYEVIGALSYLRSHHYEQLKSVCPYLTQTRGTGSFYVKIR